MLILIVFGQEPPGDDLIPSIQAAVDELTSSDLPICRFDMSRAAAEEAYGNAMFGAFRPPPSLTDLNIVHVPDWVFTHATEAFVNTTGKVGKVTIVSVSVAV